MNGSRFWPGVQSDPNVLDHNADELIDAVLDWFHNSNEAVTPDTRVLHNAIEAYLVATA